MMAICKVISHRGANRQAPQNTMPAFEKSLEIGVDGFETDVHLTVDGVPVICHNYTIDETSTGVGEISSMKLESLRRYDFGVKFHEKFSGTTLPTLEEFLTLCETADIEIMNIELKTPLNGDKSIVAKTIEAVKAHGLFDKLLISSSTRIIQWLQSIMLKSFTKTESELIRGPLMNLKQQSDSLNTGLTV